MNTDFLTGAINKILSDRTGKEVSVKVDEEQSCGNVQDQKEGPERGQRYKNDQRRPRRKRERNKVKGNARAPKDLH